MTEPILLDTGRSTSGWSFWGPAFSCDRLWYITNVQQKRFFNADALTQGSMGHTILAHYYAQLGCTQGGFDHERKHVTDPDYFLPPEEAVREWVRRREAEGQDGNAFIANTFTMFRQYRQREPFVHDRVVGVECLAKLTLGYNEHGTFGLWTDENLDDPALLDCPGLEEPHPNVPALRHNEPIVVTKRFDLVMRHRQDGKVYVWDHKVTAGGVGKTRAQQYAMDGQFAVNRIAGAQMYDNFGGMVLNLVQRRSPWTVSRQFVAPTPWRDAQLPRQIYRKAHSLATDLSATLNGEMREGDWQMTQSELLCYHRYGKCGAFDLCSFG